MRSITSKSDLRVKIFADGADIEGIKILRKNPMIRGFTTNPTLMRKSGVRNYLDFAREVVDVIADFPISLEVFSDDFREMKSQALKLNGLGENVFVKIPVTNTKGQSSISLVRELASEGVKQNVTALFTLEQTREIVSAISHGPSSYVSIFAGRVADTGIDPIPVMTQALEVLGPWPQLELIWASPRELLNVVQAHQIGCHIITVTHDLINKLDSIGKNLEVFSLETVQMFFDDAQKAGYSLG